MTQDNIIKTLRAVSYISVHVTPYLHLLVGRLVGGQQTSGVKATFFKRPWSDRHCPLQPKQTGPNAPGFI